MAMNALRLGLSALGLVMTANLAAAHPSPAAPNSMIYAKNPIVVATPQPNQHGHVHLHGQTRAHGTGHNHPHSHGWGQVHSHAHGASHHPVAAPVAAPTYDCICARSRSGDKVAVYATSSRWHGPPKAYVGAGKRLIDVTYHHQGHWRVGYYPKDEDGIQYGWVREGDLVCKEYKGGVTPVVSLPVTIEAPAPDPVQAPLYRK